ncbi:MAG: SDR family NAD(P)-dependent oxidoreductase [Alphaproteobacteria bacterium]|nr:SDR family NAD(P)-dependent oxidoreductase [Alphaproteobacteria bacterium]
MTEKTVLITGASSGIGLATMNIFAREPGWRVFATMRQLPEDRRAMGGVMLPDNVTLLPLDLGDPASVRACADALLAQSIPDLIIHNAGMQQPAAAEDTTRESLEQQFSINIGGTWQLTNALLPEMMNSAPEQSTGANAGTTKKRRRTTNRRIIFVGSVFGYSALPFRAAYVTIKHAIEGYAFALRLELEGTGISVGVVQPGPVATAFRTNAFRYIDRDALAKSRHHAHYDNVVARLTKDHKPSLTILSAEQVAKVLLALAKKRRLPHRTPVGLLAQLLWLSTFAPYAIQERLLRFASRGGRV